MEVPNNIIEFFTNVTGLIPSNSQIEFLNTMANLDEKRIITSAARQTGKSLCCAVFVIWFSFKYPNSRILLISAQHSVIYRHI